MAISGDGSPAEILCREPGEFSGWLLFVTVMAVLQRGATAGVQLLGMSLRAYQRQEIDVRLISYRSN